MSTKRQNQKEKQKIMPTIQEHNDQVAEIPKMLTSEGIVTKSFQLGRIRNNFKMISRGSLMSIKIKKKKELNYDQFEQFAQNSNNNMIDSNYPQKLIDFIHQQDCKKMQKQSVQSKQTNDFQQLQEIPNPNQLDRKSSQKQSKEIKPQSTLNEEIKIFEERIVKYTSEVNQEIKLSPKLSEEWKKKFTFMKKKK